MRGIIVAALLALPHAAGAQEAAQPPAADPVAVAVDRVRADFNARLVDYDQRIQALEARVEALAAAQQAERPGTTPDAPAPAAN